MASMLSIDDRPESSLAASAIRKVRLHILPVIFVLYIVAFLDRINIGFAALTMNADLGITSAQYGFAVGIFFFGYFILEIPSNLMLHRIGARVWISRILITWGAVAVATGFVQNLHQLVAARFLLGLAEAGFFPGMLLYLTYWFRQREQAQAMAFLVSAQPITNIFGAPVSGLILDHIHWMGIESWRWLLVLEGLPALVGGVLVPYLLPSRPADATFLTDDERGWLVDELARENRPRTNTHSFRLLFTGPVLRLAAIGFTQASAAYSLTFWLPQVVKAISTEYSNTAVGLLVAIPYSAALVSLIVVSVSSDRSQERRFHAGIPLVIGGIAYASLAVFHSSATSLALLTVAAIGMWGYFGPCFSIPGQLLSGTAAATGLAFITSVANLGGFAGPYIVGLIKRTTGDVYGGFALAGVLLWISAALILSLPATVNGRRRAVA